MEKKNTALRFGQEALFCLLLLLAGFGIELLIPGWTIVLPQWPLNLIIFLLCIALIVSAAIVFRQNAAIKRLGGIPLGMCLIITLALLSIIGGVIPQGKGTGAPWMIRLGLNEIFSSATFALVVLIFLINLGLSLVWKCVPFRSQNLQFIFFHAGFWIVMATGFLGSADLQRVIIPLDEGTRTSTGYLSDTEQEKALPFSLYLDDFLIEEYPPFLALYDPRKDQLDLDKLKSIQQVSIGMDFTFGDVAGRITELHSRAVMAPDGLPVVSDSSDAMSFAFLEGKYRGKAFSGWVSTGNPHTKPSFIHLGDKLLVMMSGNAKQFSSRVMITDEGGRTRDAVINVNAPVSVDGWSLYQMGYNEKAGRWSRESLIEGVRDPWLPVVYMGFFMMIAGNILFFWNGMKKRKEYDYDLG